MYIIVEELCGILAYTKIEIKGVRDLTSYINFALPFCCVIVNTLSHTTFVLGGYATLYEQATQFYF